MRKICLKYMVTLVALVSPTLLWAQETASVHPSQIKSALTEPVALFMVIIALLLLAVIAVLGKGIMQGVDVFKRNNINKNTSLLVVALMFTPLMGRAQDADAVVASVNTTIGGVEKGVFYFLAGIIIFEIIIILALLGIFYILYANRKSKEEIEAQASKKKIHWIERLNAAPAAKGISDEELGMGHDFDGIEELDNPTPPWWRWGFVISLVFALCYLWIYEISGTGKNQYQELAYHTAEAEEAVRIYLANSANNVDEHTVTYLDDEANLAAGKAIFVQICGACHAPDGGGNEVGPNLTDDYWLHGGSIQNIFKTIKYGVPEKGMKSWQDDYSPKEIAQLASYVKSLKGSTPAQPKAPQGELYKEEDTPAEEQPSSAEGNTALVQQL
jgi:cytochrome c oxidase cbb3-type subunit 3